MMTACAAAYWAICAAYNKRFRNLIGRVGKQDGGTNTARVI